MKCFLLGILGALLFLTVAALIIPQYSDYTARAETSKWFGQLWPILADIEKNAIQQSSLMNAGRNVIVDKDAFQNLKVNLIEITETGMVILRGGKEGQVIILIPSLDAEQVTWRCIGGPNRAVSPNCRTGDLLR